jgi:hypothetical protein
MFFLDILVIQLVLKSTRMLQFFVKPGVYWSDSLVSGFLSNSVNFSFVVRRSMRMSRREAELGRWWICWKLQGTLWKEAFPVGTEWDQYDKVYEINWGFTNLEVSCFPQPTRFLVFYVLRFV